MGSASKPIARHTNNAQVVNTVATTRSKVAAVVLPLLPVLPPPNHLYALREVVVVYNNFVATTNKHKPTSIHHSNHDADHDANNANSTIDYDDHHHHDYANSRMVTSRIVQTSEEIYRQLESSTKGTVLCPFRPLIPSLEEEEEVSIAIGEDCNFVGNHTARYFRGEDLLSNPLQPLHLAPPEPAFHGRQRRQQQQQQQPAVYNAFVDEGDDDADDALLQSSQSLQGRRHQRRSSSLYIEAVGASTILTQMALAGEARGGGSRRLSCRDHRTVRENNVTRRRTNCPVMVPPCYDNDEEMENYGQYHRLRHGGTTNHGVEVTVTGTKKDVDNNNNKSPPSSSLPFHNAFEKNKGEKNNKNKKKKKKKWTIRMIPKRGRKFYGSVKRRLPLFSGVNTRKTKETMTTNNRHGGTNNHAVGVAVTGTKEDVDNNNNKLPPSSSLPFHNAFEKNNGEKNNKKKKKKWTIRMIPKRGRKFYGSVKRRLPLFSGVNTRKTKETMTTNNNNDFAGSNAIGSKCLKSSSSRGGNGNDNIVIIDNGDANNNPNSARLETTITTTTNNATAARCRQPRMIIDDYGIIDWNSSILDGDCRRIVSTTTSNPFVAYSTVDAYPASSLPLAPALVPSLVPSSSPPSSSLTKKKKKKKKGNGIKDSRTASKTASMAIPLVNASSSLGAMIFGEEAVIHNGIEPINEIACVNRSLGIYVSETGLSAADCVDIVRISEFCANSRGGWSSYTYAKQTLGCRECDPLAFVSARPVLTACATIRRHLAMEDDDHIVLGSKNDDGARAIANNNNNSSSSSSTEGRVTDLCNRGEIGVDNMGTASKGGQQQQLPPPQKELVLDVREPHVVKYDTSTTERQKLDMHTDKSKWTFLIALSEGRGQDYKGGGTYFQALNSTVHLQRGQMLIFRGKLRHCGVRIVNGSRHLLVGFLVPQVKTIALKGDVAV